MGGLDYSYHKLNPTIRNTFSACANVWEEEWSVQEYSCKRFYIDLDSWLEEIHSGSSIDRGMPLFSVDNLYEDRFASVRVSGTENWISTYHRYLSVQSRVATDYPLHHYTRNSIPSYQRYSCETSKPIDQSLSCEEEIDWNANSQILRHDRSSLTTPWSRTECCRLITDRSPSWWTLE